MKLAYTLAVTNEKGGTAKTTTAVHLAAGLAALHEKVLVLDLDPQASASRWLGVDVAADDTRLADALTNRAALLPLVTSANVAGVDVIAGNLWLTAAEKHVADAPQGETRLRRALEALPAGRWTVVVIDTPPSLGLLTLNALAAADGVLVPVGISALDLAGLVSLTDTMTALHTHLAGVLAVRVRKTLLAGDVLAQLRARYGPLLFKTTIPESTRIAEAPGFRAPVTTTAPTSAGAVAYRALAREVLARVRKDRHA